MQALCDAAAVRNSAASAGAPALSAVSRQNKAPWRRSLATTAEWLRTTTIPLSLHQRLCVYPERARDACSPVQTRG
jgi:hypothetical protein